MAKLPQAANTAGNTQGMDDRSPMPAGDYLAHITKSEFKPTKAKNGHYLSLTWKVLEGEHKGKVFFNLLNLDNPNPVAVEIAMKELNSICQALGLQGVEDSEELHARPMTVTLKVTEGSAQYAPKNEITGYAPASGMGNATPPPAAPPVQEESAPVQPSQGVAAPSEPPPAAETPASPKLPWE